MKVAVGTDLSYEQERIVQGTAESLMKEDFAPLSVLLICNPDVKKRIGHGLDDDLFLRGKVPMTKSEVRSISLSKLRLHKDAVVWDVGAGTGSVSIEAASLAKDGVVYAIEKKDEAIDLLEQNKGACCHQCDCPGDGSRSDAVPEEHGVYRCGYRTGIGGKGKETGLL